MAKPELGIGPSGVDIGLQFGGDIERLPTRRCDVGGPGDGRGNDISPVFIGVISRGGRERIGIAVKNVFQYRRMGCVRSGRACQINTHTGALNRDAAQRGNIEIVKQFKGILIIIAAGRARRAECASRGSCRIIPGAIGAITRHRTVVGIQCPVDVKIENWIQSDIQYCCSTAATGQTKDSQCHNHQNGE